MTYDIIIIGGGISGLYNYKELIDKSKKIVLLEKNDYYGGRIFQINDKVNSQDFSFPAGAARFNLNHKHVVELLKEFNLLDFRKDKPMGANINFIDTKDIFSKSLQKYNGFHFIDKVINNSKKYSESQLRSITFKQLASFILKKEELEYMLVASGYSGQLKKMNAYDAIKLFKYDIRPNINYYNGKFNILIERIVNLLKNKNANMHLNSEVKQIIFDNNKSLYRIQYNNKIIYGEKIIFCIPKPSLLKIDILKPIHCILDKAVSCKSLCRTYAIFKKEDIWYQDIKKKIVTNNPLRYIIPMGSDNELIMISYTDDIYTNYWKKIQNNQKKLKETIVKLIKNTYNVNINEPIKVYVCYWDCGVAYWNKKINSDTMSNFLLNPLPNIYICGENYSINQSWVNGALDSCKKCINLILT